MSAWIMSIQETRFSELVGDFSFKPFSRVCLLNLWDLFDLIDSLCDRNKMRKTRKCIKWKKECRKRC
jgi:hypothetical protein